MCEVVVVADILYCALKRYLCWRLQTKVERERPKGQMSDREREKDKSSVTESLVEKERQSPHPPATPPEFDSAVQLTRAHGRLH